MFDQLIPLVLQHNSLAAYGVAAGLLILGLLTAMVGRRLSTGWVARHPQPDAPLTQAVAALIDATWTLVPLALGVAAANQVLDLPGLWHRRVAVGVGLLLITQAGYWGHTLVEVALDIWFDRHATVNAATRSGRGMLRFVGSMAVWTVALMLALRTLNVSISGLAAGLGVFGVAVTLATQSLVGDLFASLSILLDKPFLVGDTIAVGPITGSVERIGVRTTRIRNLSGEEVVVPNSDLIRARLHNYRTLRQRRVAFHLCVRYDTPPQRLRQASVVVKEAVEACAEARFDRAELLGFGDIGLRFEVVYFLASPDYALYTATQQQINWAILEGFWRLQVAFAHLAPGPSPQASGQSAA